MNMTFDACRCFPIRSTLVMSWFELDTIYSGGSKGTGSKGRSKTRHDSDHVRTQDMTAHDCGKNASSAHRSPPDSISFLHPMERRGRCIGFDSSVECSIILKKRLRGS
jgi:hypothetical protein